MHTCVKALDPHWFRYGLSPLRKKCHYVACARPRHFLHHWCHIVKLVHRNKFHWNVNPNLTIYPQEIESKDVLCIMTNDLSRSQCINSYVKRLDCISLPLTALCSVILSHNGNAVLCYPWGFPLVYSCKTLLASDNLVKDYWFPYECGWSSVRCFVHVSHCSYMESTVVTALLKRPWLM